uniref:Cyclic AMP-responsive element-binding protein 1 n=2 Tax=Lygus hesperus TaxID=30085 RepID=A0A0A9XLH1_LYGHE
MSKRRMMSNRYLYPSNSKNWGVHHPMEGMVEENGTSGSGSGSGGAGPVDPLGPPIAVTSVQSVIQANQQSVIQSATGSIQPVLTKGNVILVSKPNSVIQTTQGQLQTLQSNGRVPWQVVEAGSDDSLSNEEEGGVRKKRRDILTRRPSYRKILNDLGGTKVESSGSDCDSNLDSELSSHSLGTHYQAVIPAGTLQLTSQGEGIHTLTMTNSTTAGGTIVQYSSGQDGEFYVPGEIVVTQNTSIGGGPMIPEDQARKREMRLLKNREAARECRNKKKEYIKCLENRVAVLENQNKSLIDELKSLKELYCQTKQE